VRHRVARELDVDHRADALNDLPLLHVGSPLIRVVSVNSL
jgi:hypothetical protein